MIMKYMSIAQYNGSRIMTPSALRLRLPLNFASTVQSIAVEICQWWTNMAIPTATLQARLKPSSCMFVQIFHTLKLIFLLIDIANVYKLDVLSMVKRLFVFQDSSLLAHSSENVSLYARNENGDVTGRLSVGKRHVRTERLTYSTHA